MPPDGDPKEHLRQLIETATGEPLNERAFESLVRDGYVADWLLGEVTAEHVVEEYVRRLQRQRREREVRPDRRLAVLSEILAIEAGRLPAVQKFRDEVLRGKLLQPDEVPGWIEARTAEEGPPTLFVSLRVAAPADTVPTGPDFHSYVEFARRVIADGGKPVQVSTSRETIAFMTPDGWVKRVFIAYGGTLWRLKDAAQKVTRNVPWSEPRAVHFILTGETPMLPRARITITMPGLQPPRVTLSVDPRVSPQEVANLYRQARREVYGGTDRAISEKHLQLALFLAGKRGESLTWQAMMEDWNQLHPEWAYNNYRLFARDAAEAWRRVTDTKWEGRRSG